jgi:hypothetical protein
MVGLTDLTQKPFNLDQLLMQIQDENAAAVGTPTSGMLTRPQARPETQTGDDAVVAILQRLDAGVESSLASPTTSPRPVARPPIDTAKFMRDAGIETEYVPTSAPETSPRPEARPADLGEKVSGDEDETVADIPQPGDGLMSRSRTPITLTDDNEKNLFNGITIGESTDFNTISDTSKINPPKPLTEMTVGEVRDWQDRSVDAGSESSAAGRFQIIRRTMDTLIDNGTISRDDIFNEETQMRAYTDLLERRGYNKFRTAIAAAETPEDKNNVAIAFQLRLAKEFASIPVPFAIKKNPKGGYPKRDLVAGDSYYANPNKDGLNEARHTNEGFRSILMGFD